jgi:D-glycero-D-manno-heptose 1,7-bisphosphate phosphatase
VKLGVFIERDGVLTRVRVERQHQVTPLTADDFHPKADLAPVLNRLKAVGMLLFATTNQPGLSRGYQSRRELDRMHEMLRACLPLDDILVCPHDEVDDCPCRKPKPGLFVEASFNYRVLLDQSFVVSDKWQDAEAARCAGCTSLLIQSPWIGHVHRDFVLPDLKRVVEKILVVHAARQEAAV